MFASASQLRFCSICEFLPWAVGLATPVAGICRQEEGCGNPVMNGNLLANRAIYICGTSHIIQSASTLNSSDTGLTLNFCNA